ncbi:hypothetical protein [uncultured Aquimarina sp.]|uniref:hypothetical protein n=1 Tax=uncultured Aquimarina sp. TaxID=575652 RepID=UPI00262FF5C2|nr:hypothetical protein [uncultured Aquimarina sp.]
MQKKKINKILIIAVALIWGVVIYKFAAPYFLTNDVVVTADALVSPPKIFLRKKDTFNLNIPNRDPFLGKTLNKRNASVFIPSRPQKKSRSKTVASKSWPRIEYLGFIKSKESSSRLGLLRVNGVLKRVRSGADMQGVKVKTISEDKITLQFQKDVRDFRKAN